MNLQALSEALNLPVGTHAELADADPQTGDYRVFYIGLEKTDSGGARFVLELHRQTPQLQLWLFEAISITLGAADANGLCTIEAFQSDAPISPAGLPSFIQALAHITEALKQQKRPDDGLLRPFLSRSSYVRWVESRSREAVQ